MPWVTPRAVEVTFEQSRAWAGCGAMKAAIAPIATAATSNLVMAHSSGYFPGVPHLPSNTIAILPDRCPIVPRSVRYGYLDRQAQSSAWAGRGLRSLRARLVRAADGASKHACPAHEVPPPNHHEEN